MIDIGITGGETIAAGELVRLLINHPDVNIKWIEAKNLQGKIAHLHKGLLGECDLEFTSPQLDDVDIVFCCNPNDAPWCVKALDANPELRVIDLSRAIPTTRDHKYGMCEINRKFMVHDCYGLITLPTPHAMAVLLALIPLAKSMILGGNIDVNIKCGTLTPLVDNESLSIEIMTVLNALQPNLDCRLNIATSQPQEFAPRQLEAQVSLPCQANIGAVAQMFNTYYDDHNFTFLSENIAGFDEVNNTNKCLINIDIKQDTLLVRTVIDSLLKGCAGNAVHLMNLLFGLHEKVGLALKAQVF